MAEIFEFKKGEADKSLVLQEQLLEFLLKKGNISPEKENEFCFEWIEKYSKDFRRIYEENPNISLEEMEKALNLDDHSELDEAA